jgi:hypothetical protein
MNEDSKLKQASDQAETQTKEPFTNLTSQQKPGTRSTLARLKSNKKLLIIGGIIVLVLVLVGANIIRKTSESKDESKASVPMQSGGQNMGDADSLDPVQKGLASTGGKCEGKGSTTMTYAPMATKDIGTIAPMGGYGGSHVTPIDHQYYYGVDEHAAKDSYPVYATMDGYLTSLGNASTPTGGSNWNITLAHSCTFMIYYNLMTSIAPAIMKQVPSNWHQDAGAVKIAVKAGDIIGYVGGQSLDFELADTTFTNPKLLYHTAYNNTEPFKINVVHPLDFFADSVKSQILPKYLRIAEPRDGNYAYDIDGEAVGTWFKVGTNGYAGGSSPTSSTNNTTAGHLALAYDGFDPSALVLSIGEYDGGSPAVFIVNDQTDWTTITPSSGLVKVQLAEGSNRKADGSIWSGGPAPGGIKFVPTFNKATVLIQMTSKQEMKFEIFPGKTTAQISDFDSKAVMYNRGQDAHMNKSTTASPSVN